MSNIEAHRKTERILFRKIFWLKLEKQNREVHS